MRNQNSIFTTLGASNHTLEEREQHDYYATDPKAVELLLELEPFAPVIWEPACGEGHISKVLQAHGYQVISTDLVYRGFGDPEPLDFLKETLDGFEGDIIRTTEYEKDTVSASSSGKNYTSAFLSRSFYIITDKQKYGVYIAVCPIDEKHGDGENLVGVYNISINTLDYESGDIECNTANTIEIADHNCCVVSCYGDSSSYIVAQTGNKYEVIDIYRIINPQSIVKYNDITAWNSRDFLSFKEKFGAPYAESLDNDKEHVLADVYMYEISDSNKYAIVAVGRDDGSINALSVKDIDSQWSEDNKYEYILKNE